MKRIFFALLMLAFLPALSHAQTKVKTEGNGQTKVKTKGNPPVWAPAHGYRENRSVYFPDYYLFYQPGRGYVYWNNDAWTTSTTVPVYMNGVNLNNARMQMLSDIDVTTSPEQNYQVYLRQYPAQPVQITVPVPAAR